MAIYNFDKSQQFTSLDKTADFRSDSDQLNPMQSQYDHNNPDIATAERIALEALRVSGAWVTVYPRTEDGKFDKVWMEDKDPTYYQGFDFKAYFKPSAPEIVLTKFGLDAKDFGLELTFSRSEVLSTLNNRLIRIGDVIVVPNNSLVTQVGKFRVNHVTELGNFRYRWIYLTVACSALQHDESAVPLVK